MCESLLLRMFVAVALVSMIATANSETVTVSNSVPFASNSGATAKQKSECALDSRLPRFIAAAAEPDVEITISTEPLDKVEGNILSLKIVHVFEAGRALLLRDPAAVAVRGELYQGGDAIGSFVAFRRAWAPGEYAGISKECAWLGRATEAIGRDIAIWLKNPTKGARLGES